jgi:hypothetical protein
MVWPMGIVMRALTRYEVGIVMWETEGGGPTDRPTDRPESGRVGPRGSDSIREDPRGSDRIRFSQQTVACPTALAVTPALPPPLTAPCPPSDSDPEIAHCLGLLVNASAGSGFMHESFNMHNATRCVVLYAQRDQVRGRPGAWSTRCVVLYAQRATRPGAWSCAVSGSRFQGWFVVWVWAVCEDSHDSRRVLFISRFAARGHRPLAARPRTYVVI